MDIPERIDRAQGFFEHGRHRAALDSLRQLVRDAPESPSARLALADLYRRLGHDEQAGRWSALDPEWATDRERRAFAVFLQQWSVSPRRVLLLTRHDPLPPLPTLPPRHRPTWRVARRIDDQHADMIGPEWVRQPALGLWIAGWGVTAMSLAILVLTLLMAWAISADDAAEAALARDVGLATSSGGVLLGCVLRLPSELLARNWPQVSTLVLVSLATGFAFASLGLASLFSGA